MINNIRTLLLNVNGERLATSRIPGDEYIPAYSAVTLPPQLKIIDSILFGGAPDYEGRVYRVTQYMKLMHNSDYESYILADDPRITYDPHGVTSNDGDAVTFENSNYNYGEVSGGSEFSILGDWEGGASGNVVTKWQIASTTPTSLIVTNMNTNVSAEYPTLAGTKLLPGSTLRIAVNTQPLPANKLWTVSYRSRPQPDIGAVVASLKAAPSGVIAAVFGSEIREEPVQTFYKLFTKHPMLPQQLTGFLLAYARRINSLRVS